LQLTSYLDGSFAHAKDFDDSHQAAQMQPILGSFKGENFYHLLSNFDKLSSVKEVFTVSSKKIHSILKDQAYN
jgi:hypothetical protein